MLQPASPRNRAATLGLDAERPVRRALPSPSAPRHPARDPPQLQAVPSRPGRDRLPTRRDPPHKRMLYPPRRRVRPDVRRSLGIDRRITDAHAKTPRNPRATPAARLFSRVVSYRMIPVVAHDPDILPERYYTSTEVASALRVARETVSRWCLGGELQAGRLPGRRAGWRIAESSLRAFLARQPRTLAHAVPLKGG